MSEDVSTALLYLLHPNWLSASQKMRSSSLLCPHLHVKVHSHRENAKAKKIKNHRKKFKHQRTFSRSLSLGVNGPLL